MKTEQTSQQIFSDIQMISSTKLLTIIDELLEGVQIFDKNLNYLYINKAAERQNQRPNNELIGKSYKEVWPGIEKSHVYKTLRKCLKEQINAQFENEFNFPDDSKGWFYLCIHPLNDLIIILSMDITGRMILGKEIENHENKLREQLEEIQRWYKVTIDREQRSIQLKKEINQLLIELGRSPKYSMTDDTEEQLLT